MFKAGKEFCLLFNSPQMDKIIRSRNDVKKDIKFNRLPEYQLSGAKAGELGTNARVISEN